MMVCTLLKLIRYLSNIFANLDVLPIVSCSAKCFILSHCLMPLHVPCLTKCSMRVITDSGDGMKLTRKLNAKAKYDD